MEKFNCKNLRKFNDFNDFYECAKCGNHVCAEQAEKQNGLCPHCFGKLYRIN